MTSLADLIATAEALWPPSVAEDWDAPGLVAGNPRQNVTKVMLSVDVTSDVVECAISSGAQLLLAHHPYLMRGVTSVAENTFKGATLAKAIRADLAIFAAHTNADSVTDGVSDTLAKELGLTNIRPIVEVAESVGLGRVGSLSEDITLGTLATQIARLLPATAGGVRVAGDFNQRISRVAVCGGAGDSLLEAVYGCDADVYVTADLRHHVVQDARERALLNNNTPALIDVSHWASEFLWLEVAASQLRRIYPDVVFEVCDLRTDPWDFVITQ